MKNFEQKDSLHKKNKEGRNLQSEFPKGNSSFQSVKAHSYQNCVLFLNSIASSILRTINFHT